MQRKTTLQSVVLVSRKTNVHWHLVPRGRECCRKYLTDSVRLPCACAPSRVFGRAGGVVTRCVGSLF